MNIREQMGSAIGASDLSSSPIEERAVDRIGALAFSRTLGARLHRLKYGHDRSSWEPALRELVLMVRSRALCRAGLHRSEFEPFIERLVARALREWVGDVCERCHGRGWVHKAMHGARRQCRSCAGTGRLRPMATDRALAIGIPVERYGKHWDAWVDSIIRMLDQADASTTGVLHSQLERSSVRSTQQASPAQSPATRPTLDENNMVARLDGVARPQFPESPPDRPTMAGFVVSGG